MWERMHKFVKPKQLFIQFIYSLYSLYTIQRELHSLGRYLSNEQLERRKMHKHPNKIPGQLFLLIDMPFSCLFTYLQLKIKFGQEYSLVVKYLSNTQKGLGFNPQNHQKPLKQYNSSDTTQCKFLHTLGHFQAKKSMIDKFISYV